MCSICGFTNSCHPRCPNAEAPGAIAKCDFCGELILVGDEYVNTFDKKIHLNCIENADTTEIIKMLDGELLIASSDDLDDMSDYAYESRRDEMLLNE
jgi:hypothetical protein